MSGPTDKTDLIPGLRPHTTAGEPLPVPVSHRRRRRGMPWWAWAAIWGAPAAVVAGLVGWSLGGPSNHKPPTAVVASPTSSAPAAEVPVSLPPTTAAPAPRFSVTHSAPAPSLSAKSTSQPSPTVTPSPTPHRTRTPKPSPAPTQTTPSPAPSDTPPTPSDSPEATDG